MRTKSTSLSILDHLAESAAHWAETERPVLVAQMRMLGVTRITDNLTLDTFLEQSLQYQYLYSDVLRRSIAAAIAAQLVEE